jgi:pyruvyl transferase EpsO
MTYVNPAEFEAIDTIFLQGGGNFGDIWAEQWPNFQAFREAVIERFPDKRIVQLPQSIYFGSSKAADRAARAIESHRNFTLLVRDQRSLEFARNKFQCHSELCPDMAFALGPTATPLSLRKNVLFLLRTDKERSSDDRLPEQLPRGSVVDDWISEPRWTRSAASSLTGGRHGVGWLIGQRPREQVRLELYNALAGLRLRRGVRQLSKYKCVVSDRLHVHIICSLLGIPHIVLDNSYGKVSGFMDAFGTQWTGAQRANSLREAVALLHTSAREFR